MRRNIMQMGARLVSRDSRGVKGVLFHSCVASLILLTYAMCVGRTLSSGATFELARDSCT